MHLGPRGQGQIGLGRIGNNVVLLDSLVVLILRRDYRFQSQRPQFGTGFIKVFARQIDHEYSLRPAANGDGNLGLRLSYLAVRLGLLTNNGARFRIVSDGLALHQAEAS